MPIGSGSGMRTNMPLCDTFAVSVRITRGWPSSVTTLTGCLKRTRDERF